VIHAARIASSLIPVDFRWLNDAEESPSPERTESPAQGSAAPRHVR
jgi:hypothetical protein